MVGGKALHSGHAAPWVSPAGADVKTSVTFGYGACVTLAVLSAGPSLFQDSCSGPGGRTGPGSETATSGERRGSELM